MWGSRTSYPSFTLSVVRWAGTLLANTIRPYRGHHCGQNDVQTQAWCGYCDACFYTSLIAAAAALILAPSGCTASVAYVAGTMGTLIGADLLNWKEIQNLGGQMVSIGGAGIFDGVF